MNKIPDEKETIALSKFLSLVLRHKPQEIGIRLDEQGWVSVQDLLYAMENHGRKMDIETLKHVVETNSKKRFAFSEDGTKIRASQGHSLNVDLGYEPAEPPEILYHGTAQKSVESILSTGIEKRSRHLVHLSADTETAIKVGQRHGKPTVLIIKSREMHNKGHNFYLSANNVWLTEYIPPEFISLEK
jgi:putative RNA 2'-phosphotransferase